ncbi:MAG: hypothetical protein PGN25_06270 [Methylorubrum populi]
MSTTDRFAAGTEWRSGKYMLALSIGVFSSREAALAYAATGRSILVRNKRLFVDHSDVLIEIEGHLCLYWDEDLFEQTQSWPDASIGWLFLLGMISSGPNFECVRRTAILLPSSFEPTPEDIEHGATDLAPSSMRPSRILVA